MNILKKSIYVFCLLFIVSLSLKAQVGIGTTNPNASAQLDVSSTTKGFLPPRMTFAQRNAIASPVQGLIIYCTDCVANGQIQVYNGNSWVYFDGQPFSVRIGTQVWMTENLNVATYRDGTLIPQVTDPNAWAGLTTGAWCWYNNDSATYAATYGRLYNWYAVSDPRGLAPSGWKIPSIEDWRKLEKSVNSTYPYISSIDLILMSSTNWKNGENGKDLFNFNAQPGGYVTTSIFSEIGEIAYFWSTQKKNNDNIIDDNVYLRFYLSSNAFQSGSCRDAFNGSGFSVRCLSMEEQPIRKNKKVEDT